VKQKEHARRLRDLEKENNRLKRVVADLNLEKVVLREALKYCQVSQLNGKTTVR
jgi:hypothetical protein